MNHRHPTVGRGMTSGNPVVPCTPVSGDHAAPGPKLAACTIIARRHRLAYCWAHDTDIVSMTTAAEDQGTGRAAATVTLMAHRTGRRLVPTVRDDSVSDQVRILPARPCGTPARHEP